MIGSRRDELAAMAHLRRSLDRDDPYADELPDCQTLEDVEGWARLGTDSVYPPGSTALPGDQHASLRARLASGVVVRLNWRCLAWEEEESHG